MHPSLRRSKVPYLCYSGKLQAAVELLCSQRPPWEEQTYELLLQETIHREEYRLGKRIHAQMLTSGFAPGAYLQTKLVILHAKSGDLSAAHKLFDKMFAPSTVLWNAMISGYVQNSREEEGLQMFFLMRLSGQKPDQFSFSSAFRACAKRATLECGRRIHAVMEKSKAVGNVVVSSALVDMYFKCGEIADGQRAFDISPERNLVTWTALISGYGAHGIAEEVIRLFRRMIEEGFRPNHITFVSILSACGRRGLMDQAWEFFDSMSRNYRIWPRGEHYAAMVDLLGRLGRLREAYDLAERSPFERRPAIWGALLGACKIHGNAEMVEIVAKRVFDLVPECTGKYVVLSNFCASEGRWREVEDIHGMIEKQGKKDPGQSSVEIRGKVHTFLSGKRYHEAIDVIEAVIRSLSTSSPEGTEVISGVDLFSTSLPSKNPKSCSAMNCSSTVSNF